MIYHEMSPERKRNILSFAFSDATHNRPGVRASWFGKYDLEGTPPGVHGGSEPGSHTKSGALAPINPARFRDRRPSLSLPAAQIPIRSTSSSDTVWRRRS